MIDTFFFLVLTIFHTKACELSISYLEMLGIVIVYPLLYIESYIYKITLFSQRRD